MLSVKCNLKAKRKKNAEEHFIQKKGMLHQGLKVKKLNNFSNFKSVMN